jgi:hypothetical protein
MTDQEIEQRRGASHSLQLRCSRSNAPMHRIKPFLDRGINDGLTSSSDPSKLQSRSRKSLKYRFPWPWSWSSPANSNPTATRPLPFAMFVCHYSEKPQRSVAADQARIQRCGSGKAQHGGISPSALTPSSRPKNEPPVKGRKRTVGGL